jgi:alkanesulfonate monooxygenase SsuD/methylene tetrahydromethanopterin reductase-like flavin-dependent oxidoreductase (luciferase family)
VGIYLDRRNAPGRRRSSTHAHGFGLELAEAADRLGAHSLWLSEHHGFDDGYLPQPLTYTAVVASRTRRLRLGTAVVLAAFRPAPALAEEAALVDLVSQVRLELGLESQARPARAVPARADRVAPRSGAGTNGRGDQWLDQ